MSFSMTGLGGESGGERRIIIVDLPFGPVA
jgi:hypothetical protein